MPRRTKDTREANLRQMEESLLDGINPSKIVTAAVSKFSISEAVAWEDLKEIRSRWDAEGKEHRDPALANRHLTRAVRRREEMYRRAMLANDIRSALAIEQDICRLQGVYPVEKQKVEHSGAGGAPIQIISIEAIRPPQLQAEAAQEEKAEQSAAVGGEAFPRLAEQSAGSEPTATEGEPHPPILTIEAVNPTAP